MARRCGGIPRLIPNKTEFGVPAREQTPCHHHYVVSKTTVIGTADPAFDPALVEEVSTVEETEALVAAGADHGLDIAGDVVGSIQAVASVE